MVGESKKSIVQVQKSNRASTSSRRTMECRSEKPWLRSQSQKSEPTPPLSEDPNASTQIPSTILDRPSSPTITNPDTNTTAASSCCCQPAACLLLVQLAASSCCCEPADAATLSKKKGRGPTTNPSAKKRKEGKKGKVEISKRLGRVVGGLQLTEFITEMGVVLRQYAPLDVNKWAEVPMHYKDKMWADLMKQFEDVRNSQKELGDPPLSTEEHLTKAFGARSGYLRGLGCGPKPLSSKNLEAKASKEAIERQIEELKNELKQSREENEEREARLQKEKDEREERFKKEIEEIKAHFSKDEREERFKKEIEDIKAHFKAEFNEQLKIIVQLYGAPTTSSPPSTQNR
uniref:Uncharacterized protein n=1 Tax=Ananas comosus var. bracteatus TaxID=296719 RepID=A0A6V7P471_ANACO|nr:unnamed protein product [Ananas comosus var. bracteatus]